MATKVRHMIKSRILKCYKCHGEFEFSCDWHGVIVLRCPICCKYTKIKEANGN